MTDERAHARECHDASVVRGGDLNDGADAHGRYEIECIGADGIPGYRLLPSASQEDAALHCYAAIARLRLSAASFTA